MTRRPRSAPPIPNLERWVEHVTSSQSRRVYHQPHLLALDGIGLVDSLTVPDLAHEVVVQDGKVQRCSCWAWKTHRCCVHVADVALYLHRRVLLALATSDTGVAWAIDTAAPRALARMICRQYIAFPEPSNAEKEPPYGPPINDTAALISTSYARPAGLGPEWGTRANGY